MNIQSAESTSASVPAVETTVTSGDSSKNVVEQKNKAINNAKDEILNRNRPKVEAQTKVDSVVPDSKGEEPVVEVDKTNEESIPNKEEVVDTDRLLKLRTKDKKEISKLTARNYALKEEVAKYKAEVEKFNSKLDSAPKEEDFKGDINAYQRALTRHEIDIDNSAVKLQETEKQIIENRDIEWEERAKATVKDIDKFTHLYTTNFDALKHYEKELMDYASKSIYGPRIIESAFEKIFSNNESKAQWRALGPEGRRQAIVEEEREIMREYRTPSKQQAPVQKSKAVAMINPEKNSDRVATKPSNQKSAIAKYISGNILSRN